MSLMVKVSVDDNECTGCGLCYNDECPEIFMEGDGGTSNLKPEFRKGGALEGDVPEAKKGCAEKAADACPVSAIKVG